MREEINFRDVISLSRPGRLCKTLSTLKFFFYIPKGRADWTALDILKEIGGENTSIPARTFRSLGLGNSSVKLPKSLQSLCSLHLRAYLDLPKSTFLNPTA